MMLPPEISVSRETQERLTLFVAILEKWNAKINLIGRSTHAEIWQRHVVDSLQVVQLAPPSPRCWADIGSGGGFPGLVVAIVLSEKSPDSRLHLVESDQRKAAFLRESSRQLSLPVTVHAVRIESLPSLAADVISARALAPLHQLCAMAVHHLSPEGMALFPKGASWADEVAKARLDWNFHLESCPSLTSPDAAILKLKDLSHA